MSWEERPLGEVLRKDLDCVPVTPGTTYLMTGVLSFGRGLFSKPATTGDSSSYSTFYRLHEGQLVMSQLFGWEGALAMVTPQFAGTHVSSQFPTFRANQDAADIGFIAWVVRQPAFWKQLASKAVGMGVRRKTLNPDALFSCVIPLPPVEEQRRIVAKLDAAAERIARIEAAQSANAEDFDRVVEALLFNNPSATPTPMREVVTQRPPDTKVEGDESYDFAGVYSFGRGVFRSVTKTGLDFAYAALTQVRAGEFIYPKLMAWEGAFGIVPPECDGCFVSPEFPVFTVQTDCVLPELLDAYFRSPRVWPEIAAISSGTNARRRRLQPSSFLSYKFPLPNRADQERIRVALQARARLRAAQQSRVSDLSALMPALLDRAFKGEL